MEKTTASTFPGESQTIWAMEIAIIVMKKWLLFPFAALGMFGNVVTLCVTAKKENRRLTTCIYMSALAVMDNVFLIAWASYSLAVYHGLGDDVRNRQVLHV